MISHSRLLEVLEYSPDTGDFKWIASNHRVKAGDLAGTVSSKGYVLIKVDGVSYRAHRLAWFYVNGVWPTKDLDHEDRTKLNNRMKNLREATHSMNMHNRGVPGHNISGVKGVSWYARTGTWRASYQLGKKEVHLGYFKSKEKAIEIRNSALLN